MSEPHQHSFLVRLPWLQILDALAERCPRGLWVGHNTTMKKSRHLARVAQFTNIDRLLRDLRRRLDIVSEDVRVAMGANGGAAELAQNGDGGFDRSPLCGRSTSVGANGTNSEDDPRRSGPRRPHEALQMTAVNSPTLIATQPKRSVSAVSAMGTVRVSHSHD